MLPGWRNIPVVLSAAKIWNALMFWFFGFTWVHTRLLVQHIHEYTQYISIYDMCVCVLCTHSYIRLSSKWAVIFRIWDRIMLIQSRCCDVSPVEKRQYSTPLTPATAGSWHLCHKYMRNVAVRLPVMEISCNCCPKNVASSERSWERLELADTKIRWFEKFWESFVSCAKRNSLLPWPFKSADMCCHVVSTVLQFVLYIHVLYIQKVACPERKIFRDFCRDFWTCSIHFNTTKGAWLSRCLMASWQAPRCHPLAVASTPSQWSNSSAKWNRNRLNYWATINLCINDHKCA